MPGGDDIQLDYFSPEALRDKPYRAVEDNSDWNGLFSSAIVAAALTLVFGQFPVAFCSMFGIPISGICFVFPAMGIRYLLRRPQKRFAHRFAATFVPAAAVFFLPLLHLFPGAWMLRLAGWVCLFALLIVADRQSGCRLGSTQSHWFIGGLIWPAVSIGLANGLPHESMTRFSMGRLLLLLAAPMALPYLTGLCFRMPSRKDEL